MEATRFRFWQKKNEKSKTLVHVPADTCADTCDQRFVLPVYAVTIWEKVKINLKDKKQIGYKQGGQLRQTIPDFLSCVFRHTTMRDWLSIRKS